MDRACKIRSRKLTPRSCLPPSSVLSKPVMLSVFDVCAGCPGCANEIPAGDGRPMQ